MTILFSLGWLGEHGERIERHRTWLNHYQKIRNSLHWDKAIMLDDGSPEPAITQWELEASNLLTIVRQEHLGRLDTYVYPYVWRAVEFVKGLFLECDRLFWIETDFFVYSERMAHLMTCSDGFYTPWCPNHKMPETGCMVISGRKGIERFKNWSLPNWNASVQFESLVHTDGTWKDLKGDRWSEYPIAVPPDADFAAQV